MHVIYDNGNYEIRGSGVERDAGGDEKQLIMFAWPYTCIMCKYHWNQVFSSHLNIVAIGASKNNYRLILEITFKGCICISNGINVQ